MSTLHDRSANTVRRWRTVYPFFAGSSSQRPTKSVVNCWIQTLLQALGTFLPFWDVYFLVSARVMSDLRIPPRDELNADLLTIGARLGSRSSWSVAMDTPQTRSPGRCGMPAHARPPQKGLCHVGPFATCKLGVFQVSMASSTQRRLGQQRRRQGRFQRSGDDDPVLATKKGALWPRSKRMVERRRREQACLGRVSRSDIELAWTWTRMYWISTEWQESHQLAFEMVFLCYKSSSKASSNMTALHEKYSPIGHLSLCMHTYLSIYTPPSDLDQAR